MVANVLYILLLVFAVMLLLRLFGVLVGSLFWFGTPIGLVLLILIILAIIPRSGG